MDINNQIPPQTIQRIQDLIKAKTTFIIILTSKLKAQTVREFLTVLDINVSSPSMNTIEIYLKRPTGIGFIIESKKTSYSDADYLVRTYSHKEHITI